MRRRLLSIVLIILIIISNFAIEIPTLSAYGSLQPELYEGKLVDGSDSTRFLRLKPQLPLGTTSINRNGFKFNYTLWQDKGIVVYGHALQVPSAVQDWKYKTQVMIDDKPIVYDNKGYYRKGLTAGGGLGEYRYHGFDAMGNKYSNINFPNDSSEYSQLHDRIWLYQPWDNKLISEEIRQSLYNESATRGNTTTQAWIENTIKNVNITEAFGINGVEMSASDVSRTRKYDYLHVQSPPTAILPGEARMWHKSDSGLVYYQTLSVPQVGPFKQVTSVTAKVEVLDAPRILDVEGSSENDDIKVPVTVKVTAMLNDQEFYTDPVERVNHYTRLDIKNWDIQLAVNGRNLPPPSNVNTMDNIAWAIYEAELTQGEIKANGFKAHFNGTGTVKYLDDKTASAANLYTHNFLREIVQVPPLQLDTHPVIPKDWYDIVEFPARDNTDMTNVVKREVYINGTAVEAAAFYSGSYIFGDEQVGLNEIRLFWTLSDGQVYESVLFTVIHSTIPRAQYKISGSYKQNRKLTFSDYCTSGNDPFVLDKYPIDSYSWSFKRLDGDSSALKRKSVSDTQNEIVCKEPGVYCATLVVSNTLGRISEPYTVTFRILEDYPAAVIFNLNNSVTARNESISAYAYEAVSTDGDIIESNALELWYDSDNNGSYDKLLNTWTSFSEFPSYTPTMLGRYKFVNKVTERFGESTISEFVTAADKKVKVIEREFLVDNYIPMTGLYVDIPIVRPELDLFFMLDEGLKETSLAWMKDNRMNIANTMRLSNIIAKVENWDLKTYTYSQAASTAKNTGKSRPPASITYTSNGYTGTLDRIDVADNGDYQDFGDWETKTLSKTARDTASGYSWAEYDSTGKKIGGGKSDTPSISYSDSDGYSGTLRKTSYTQDSEERTNYADGGYLIERYYTGYYSGTVTKKERYWVPDYRWVPDYTGYYSGTIYKSMQTPYFDPFTATHKKYAIYITDTDVNNISNLNMLVNSNEVDVILIGNSASQSQVEHDYFILNDSSGIESLVDKALNWVAEQNPVPTEDILTTQNTLFTISESDYDEEGDLLINKSYQYVHYKEHYDNPTGQEPGTQTAYSDTAGWTDVKKNKFANVGLYTVYRRVQDQPTTDPNFEVYNRTSNIPYIKVGVHRIPVAQAVMTWRYNAVSSLYELTFTDNSYDLDHQFSREDKGIIETSIRYRKDAGEWNYKMPTDLTWGSYQIEYYVKDVEQAWSKPFIMDAVLSQVPPANITIESNIVQKDEKMRGDATIPAGETLQLTSPGNSSGPIIHSNVPIVSAQVLVDGAVKGALTLTAVPSETEYLYNTSIFEYAIPSNKADSNITVAIKATSSVGSQSKEQVHTISVYTPIWEDYTSGRLAYITNSLEGVPASMELSATTAHDMLNDFKVVTSKYTSKLQVSIGGITYYLLKNGKVSTSRTGTGTSTITVNNSTRKFKVDNIAVAATENNREWCFSFSVVNNYPLRFNQPVSISFTGYDEAGNSNTASNKHGYNPQVKTITPNNYLLYSFRVVNVREPRLAPYYSSSAAGLGHQQYIDKPMFVNSMALDGGSFGLDSLTRGYRLEFEIDSRNFNETSDTIVIEPHFYTADGFIRDDEERDIYWEDSKHNIFGVGEGGHEAWRKITLTGADRRIRNADEAVWRGEYLIPATSWAVPRGTSKENAKNKALRRDIIVSFGIRGYKNGVLQFDFNKDQWPEELTVERYPYKVGDVIRYSWERSYLEDIKSKDNR